MGDDEAEERTKIIWLCLHLFIYMEIIYFHFLFHFFVPLGHLGVFPSTLHHKFQQLGHVTPATLRKSSNSQKLILF